MRKQAIKKISFYFAAIVIGLLLTLLLIEAGLRIGGYFVDRKIKQRIYSAPVRRPDFLILCAGDSHTEGVGAPKGFDYPSQLQALLNSKSKSIGFEVINLGRAGCNSSQAANLIVEFIESSHRTPNIIIFCAGNNNAQNFADARILPEDIRRAEKRVWLKYLFANSRAFHFGEMTAKNLEYLINKEEIGEIPWDGLLDETRKGRGERKLLTNWFLSDIEFLLKEVESKGSKLVLLSYYSTNEWLYKAMEEASRRYGLVFIDVSNFGFPKGISSLMLNKYTASDWHPNERGYARIAEIVYSRLVKEELVPISIEGPANTEVDKN